MTTARYSEPWLLGSSSHRLAPVHRARQSYDFAAIEVDGELALLDADPRQDAEVTVVDVLVVFVLDRA